MNVQPHDLSFLITELGKLDPSTAPLGEQVEKALRAYESKHDKVLTTGERFNLLAEVGVHLARREAQKIVETHAREVEKTREGLLEAVEVASPAALTASPAAEPVSPEGPAESDQLVVALATTQPVTALVAIDKYPLPKDNWGPAFPKIHDIFAKQQREAGPTDVGPLCERFLSYAAQVSKESYPALVWNFLKALEPQSGSVFLLFFNGFPGVSDFAARLRAYETVRLGAAGKGLPRDTRMELQKQMMEQHAGISYDQKVQLIEAVYGSWGLNKIAEEDNAKQRAAALRKAFIEDLPRIAAHGVGTHIIRDWLRETGQHALQVSNTLLLTTTGICTRWGRAESHHIEGLTPQVLRKNIEDQAARIAATGEPRGFSGNVDDFRQDTTPWVNA